MYDLFVDYPTNKYNAYKWSDDKYGRICIYFFCES